MSTVQSAESVRRLPDAAIVELRQYTLHPGQRDVLIELFDREFIETQEAAGMTVIGQFRDLDRPDCFVWLRGFHDMPSRRAALTAFYDGPIWRAHVAAANRTMIDSDNVLLLEPASSETMFPPAPRAGTGAAAADTGLIVATIYYPRPDAKDFAAFFARSVRPVMIAAGAAIVAEYSTSAHANDFRLPVREGEHAFVWFARLRAASAYEAYRTSLAGKAGWRGAAAQLEAQLVRPTETLRLVPTPRSRLRG